MDSTITSGIINYPILYFNHYHQQEIVDQIIEATHQLFPKLEGIKSFSPEQLKIKARVKIIDFNSEPSNSNVIWAESPKFEEVKQKNLEWMYTNELRAIIQSMDLAKTSIDATQCVYIFRSVSYKLLTKNAEFIACLHKFISLYECWQKRERDINWTIVLIVPSGELPPPSIEGVVRIVPIAPPKKEVIQEIIQKEFAESTDSEKEEFCKSLQGLQLFDIRQIIQSTKTVIGKKLSYRSVKWARDEKQQIIRKTGILDVVTPNVTFDHIGGLRRLKKDLKIKAQLFKHLNILQNDLIRCPVPKGVLLIGMPGCGKTMIAKAVASEFELPLLKLDIGKLLGQYVGQSEANLRRALDVVDSAHPCVLWIDEIEKAFAGTYNTSGDNNDLMMRLMGTFLTWMQERENPVYIVATANDVLKPELMRKGRFDDVYFVDFPNEEERSEIIQSIVNEYSKTKIKFPPLPNEKNQNIEDWMKLSRAMRIQNCKNKDIGLSGAEIRSLITSIVEKKIIAQIETLNKQNDIGKWDIKTFLSSIIEISYKDLYDLIEEFKDEAMVKQSLWLFRESDSRNKKDKPSEDDKRNNFIDRIYDIEIQYQFKQAD